MTSESPEPQEKQGGVVPSARVKSAADRLTLRSLSTRLWGLTAAALLVAVGLVVWNHQPSGPTITIRFDQGHGLRPGNSLQHRGIQVGTVTEVGLTHDAKSVAVRVEILPGAAMLARHGSEFWVVRPRVSLTRVSGLETVVGARYIEVQPGPLNSAAKFDFDGLETPLTLPGSDAVEIEIRFQHGDGLSVGDEVRHRGIVVGEVTAVDLNDELTGVVVRVRLLQSAVRLARHGTQFWVERPTVSAAEVRGLDTLIGGHYIAVQPGPADAGTSRTFEGLTEAPAGELPEGGVEIVLEAAQRGGLRRGVPVLYRGQQVGHVITVALSSDAASVEARVWIDAAYRELVRDNTRFWMNSGIDVSVGLNGLKLSADTLSSIIVGGVSLATPAQPGVKVSTGHRFVCAAEADDEWLAWEARIPLGEQQFAGKGPLPVPVRASLRWQETTFGFRRDRQRSGWILPLSDGHLLAPADLLLPVEQAIEGTTKLEAAGESVDPVAAEVIRHGGLALLNHWPESLDAAVGVSRARLSAPVEPVDCLIITSGADSILSLTASRLHAGRVRSGSSDGQPGRRRGDAWLIDPSVQFTADQHGACVMSREDGTIIGLLIIDSGQNRIALVDQRLVLSAPSPD